MAAPTPRRASPGPAARGRRRRRCQRQSRWGAGGPRRPAGRARPAGTADGRCGRSPRSSPGACPPAGAPGPAGAAAGAGCRWWRAAGAGGTGPRPGTRPPYQERQHDGTNQHEPGPARLCRPATLGPGSCRVARRPLATGLVVAVRRCAAVVTGPVGPSHRHHARRRGRRPRRRTAEPPRSSSIRSSWLYLATRSERAGAPVLICPAFDRHRQVGDRRVLGLAGPVRDHRAVRRPGGQRPPRPASR